MGDHQLAQLGDDRGVDGAFTGQPAVAGTRALTGTGTAALSGTVAVAGKIGAADTEALTGSGTACGSPRPDSRRRSRCQAGYPSGSYSGITQWLDDDHVVMWAEDGSLLVCPLPDGRCRTIVKHGGVISFGGH